MNALSILALEPWYGGSHARFLDGWRELSRHRVEILGLPARNWKWHMTAGAWALAERLREECVERCDLVVGSDFLDMSMLPAYLPAGWRDAPRVLYMHENQLTYPPRPGTPESERDLTWSFRNVFSCLAADEVVFNSRFHADAFARAADELCARMPKPTPRGALADKLRRAEVVSPGVELAGLPLGAGPGRDAPLRVVFNHRWEHDKDPLAFLRAARSALAAGARLELVLLGEHFSALPHGVADLLEELDAHVLQRGFAPDRGAYARWLGSCDLVVSTARHEFFGIAVLEAAAAGCTPLLPARLSYPDLVPEAEHAVSLYAADAALAQRLIAAAATPERWRTPERRARMRRMAEPHDRTRTAASMDTLCERLVPGRTP